jgi:hypothetical protein
VHRYGTSRVYSERMCMTIKLFWLTSALISFHNIAVLQRCLYESRVLRLLVSNTLVIWRSTPSGLAKLHLQRFIAGLAKSKRPGRPISGAIGSPFQTR